ncbi:MAG: hypothetical protein MSH08_06585 [Ezakiella sp.]|nr:hypothetical protein [Ezakiella sp.]MDD7471992.1 hypothetical protein [Bacillota bacterium]MDY3923956.1 hypothetical protein [Ezakiella sp.]
MILINKLIKFYNSYNIKLVEDTFYELYENVLSYEELFFHLANPNSMSASTIKILNIGDDVNIREVSENAVSTVFRVVDKREYNLSFVDIFKSLRVIFTNFDDFIFTYNSGNFHDILLDSNISYVNIFANGNLIVKCKYFQSINGEYTDNVTLFVEYNIDNINRILNIKTDAVYTSANIRNCEFFSFLDEESNIDNEEINFKCNLDMLKNHLRENRLMLAYMSFLEAGKDLTMIKAKTGTSSENFMKNNAEITKLNVEIRKRYLQINNNQLVIYEGAKNE